MVRKTSERTRQKIKMVTILAITTAMFITELIVGYISKSLALVNDSFNMISDVLSLLIGFICLLLATKETTKNTYGWARVEIWAALVNSVFMLALCFSIFTSAIQRLISTEKVEKADLVLIVGGVGLAINLIGVGVFLDETIREMKESKKKERKTEEQRVEEGQPRDSNDGVTNQSFVTVGETGFSEQQSPEIELPIKKRKMSVTSIDRPTNWSHGVELANEKAFTSGITTKNGDTILESSEVSEVFQQLEVSGVRCRSVNLESSCSNTSSDDEGCGIPDDDEEEMTNMVATVSHIYAGPPMEDEDEIPRKNQKKKKNKKIKSGNQMNIQGIFLHLLGDALGSVSVIVSGLINKYCEGNWVDMMDPAISLVMVIIIVITTVPLVKQTTGILLQRVPKNVKIHLLIAELRKEVKDIANIHDLHVWQLAGTRIIASLHIRCSDLTQYIRSSKQIKAFFHNNGIHSITIQPEFQEHQKLPSERECYLECGPDLKCHEDTCCCVNKKSKKKKISTTSTASGISSQSALSTDTAISLESDCGDVSII